MSFDFVADMEPPYAPNVVLNRLKKESFDGTGRYFWTAGTMASATGLNYKLCQIILGRFYADGFLERQTARGMVKSYRLK